MTVIIVVRVIYAVFLPVWGPAFPHSLCCLNGPVPVYTAHITSRLRGVAPTLLSGVTAGVWYDDIEIFLCSEDRREKNGM